MRVIFSWKETNENPYRNKLEEAFFMFYSVKSWSKFYKTELYTDEYGRYKLQEVLGLPFNKVFSNLPEYPEMPWNFSKFYAIKEQKGPFIHVDFDTFIFGPLDNKLFFNDGIAQSVETPRDEYRIPHEIMTERLTVKPEITLGKKIRAQTVGGYCAGVIGFMNKNFHQEYVKNTWDILVNQQNYGAFVSDYTFMWLEQAIFRFIAEQKKYRMGFVSGSSSKYTHAWAGSKRNDTIVAKVIARVTREYPDYLDRIFKYSEVT